MPTLMFSGSIDEDADKDYLQKSRPEFYISPYAKKFEPRGTGGKEGEGTTSRSKKLSAGKFAKRTFTTLLPDRHEHDYYCVGGDCSREGGCQGGEDRHLDAAYEARTEVYYGYGDEFYG